MNAPLLDIPLRPSRILALVLVLLYGLTGLLLILAPLAVLLRLLLLALFLAVSWRAWRGWRLLASVRRLQVMPEFYRLITTDGDLDVTAGEQTLVTPWLVILHLRGAGRAVRLPLLPDTSSAEDRRRLRVWLRCN